VRCARDGLRVYALREGWTPCVLCVCRARDGRCVWVVWVARGMGDVCGLREGWATCVGCTRDGMDDVCVASKSPSHRSIAVVLVVLREG
jgi:hypothetical protein